MEIYESYELAEGSFFPSLTHSFESIENILDTIETIRYNSNEDFFAFSSEGFVDFVKKIWDKFVALVKRFANWIKELFGRIFQTGVLRKAVKGAKYSVNIAFKKGFKSESIIKKYGSDDKVMKEFRKYCVDLRFFTWFAFGSGGEDIDAISKSLNSITDIDSIISKLMESGADISDTVKSYSKAFEDDYNVIQGYIENNDKGYNQKLNREQTENSDSPIVNAVKTIRDVFMKVVGNNETFEQYYDKSLDFKKRKEVPMFHANKVYDRQKVLENFMKTFNDLTAKIEKYDTSKYTEKEDAEKISKVCQMLATVFKTVSKFLSFINNNIMSAAKSIITLKKENKKISKIVDDIEKTGGRNIGVHSPMGNGLLGGFFKKKERTFDTVADIRYSDEQLENFRNIVTNTDKVSISGVTVYVCDDMDESSLEDAKQLASGLNYSPYWTYTMLSAERKSVGIDNEMILCVKSFYESVKDINNENVSMNESITLHELGHNKIFSFSGKTDVNIDSLRFIPEKGDDIFTGYAKRYQFDTNDERLKYLFTYMKKNFKMSISSLVYLTIVKNFKNEINASILEEVISDVHSIVSKPSYNIYKFLTNNVDYSITSDKYVVGIFLNGMSRLMSTPDVKIRTAVAKAVTDYCLKKK